MSSSSSTKRELRLLLRAEHYEAGDMIAMANDLPFTTWAVRQLERLIALERRRASLIVRGPELNPTGPDSGWSELGSAG